MLIEYVIQLKYLPLTKVHKLRRDYEILIYKHLASDHDN